MSITCLTLIRCWLLEQLQLRVRIIDWLWWEWLSFDFDVEVATLCLQDVVSAFWGSRLLVVGFVVMEEHLGVYGLGGDLGVRGIGPVIDFLHESFWRLKTSHLLRCHLIIIICTFLLLYRWSFRLLQLMRLFRWGNLVFWHQFSRNSQHFKLIVRSCCFIVLSCVVDFTTLINS